MNETMIILILGMMSYIFMGYLFSYLYKESGINYMLELSMAWYCCASIFIIYITNEVIDLNGAYLIVIDILTYGSVFFLFKALYSFIKMRFSKNYKKVLALYVINAAGLFVIGMFLFQNQVYPSCIFSGIISSGVLIIFCNWKLRNSRRYFIGNLYTLIGIIFTGISMMKQSENVWDIWTFISIMSICVIGVGFILGYYEKAKRELEKKDERYRLSIEASNSELWEYNIGRNSLFLPKHMGRNFSDRNIEFEMFKKELFEKVHPEDLQHLKNAFVDHIEGRTDKYVVEYRLKDEDGGYRWILSKGKVLRDEEGIPIKVFGADTDISEIKNAQEEIRNLAYYDNLTGFLNRNAFINVLHQEIKNAEDLKVKCAVASINFDNFKLVNDTVGHECGDKFLKKIGEELKACIKKDDVIARFGGDEFTILYTNVNLKDEVKNFMYLILEKFKRTWSVEDYEVEITASIGISLYPDDGDNSEELIKKSNIAMYKSKSNGKNQYKFYEEYMNNELKFKINMQKKLKEAVRSDAFSVYYQPQIDAVTGKTSGMEALVRWINSEGNVPPNDFIPLAEETGIIIPIGEYVLRNACLKNKAWNSLRKSKLVVSVNVSVVQLNQKDFVDRVKKVLDEIGIEPQYLILEITESILIKSFEANIKKLEELRAMGIKIALDDFGIGYSSLSYLINLPIDILKIDRAFVDDITKNSKKASIIESIISLAQKINIQVVVEGVETKEQYDILVKQKCDKIQGYYFSKPLTEEEFENYILK